MEKFFWADQIAEKIINERKSKEYVCASGITPSGTIHIGNFREIITTDLVVRALKDKGKKVRFIYSWDDYDRLRKVPGNISEEKKKEWEKYIGMPLSEIPSPFNKNKSYAEYFEDEFEDISEKVGINPEFIRQNKMNKKCRYADLIKTAFENRKKIIEILNRYRKEPIKENWMPVEVYCEKCKKDFTKIISVKNYEIEYECRCGFKNKIDYRKKGIVKMRWRVDWPARWSYEKVNFEPGGDDHSSYGGSYMTGKDISKEIYNFEAPLYIMYGFVSKKGVKGKMSSSAGNVFTVQEVENVYEPNILRYLFVGTRPNKGFDISFDNDVIKNYDDFDELERKYYSKEASHQEKRMYELSVLELKKIPPKRHSFRHLITLVQIGKTKGFSKEDKIRAEKVRNWLENYASEDMKFSLQKKINFKLDNNQKKAMIMLRNALHKRNLTEDKLFNEFYDISKKVGIQGKEFFETAYKVIIGKSKGPRLATLILSIGNEKVIKLLEQIK